MVRPSASAFCERGPALGVPGLDGSSVALGRSRLGQPGALPERTNDAADVGRMVRDAKELFDEGGDARGGPDIADNAEGGSAFGEGSPQLRALVATQARRRAWGDAPVQTGHAACSAAFDPLADRARGDTQGRAAMSFCFQPC